MKVDRQHELVEVVNKEIGEMSGDVQPKEEERNEEKKHQNQDRKLFQRYPMLDIG